jgi:hypothetical protein
MEWIVDAGLSLLLAATLFHAVRLERALGVLKRDRAELEALVAGFNASTRAAEQGIDRLRDAAEGAGRQIARQVEAAVRLRDDLSFLMERGERTADRLDQAVRAARPVEPAAELPMPDGFARDSFPEPPAPPQRSRAEQELMRALRLVK